MNLNKTKILLGITCTDVTKWLADFSRVSHTNWNVRRTYWAQYAATQGLRVSHEGLSQQSSQGTQVGPLVQELWLSSNSDSEGQLTLVHIKLYDNM